MKHLIKTAWIFIAALVCTAASFASVSVSISPTTVQVQPGGQTQFNAVVTGNPSSVVVWSLTGTNCGGNACGQITGQGLYTAPAVAPNPNVVTVTATSLADLSASASAAAIIGTSSDITVNVSPANSTVLVGQQQLFVAYVSGTTITGVTWHLSGPACASSACGTISSGGVYTAPANLPSPAQVSVVATSIADPSRSGSAAVTVALPVSVSVSPSSAQVIAGAQKQFKATVSNTSNTTVTWSVGGSGCSGTSCGTISSNGLYTAPSTVPNPAQVSITATSVADTTKSSTATVTIIPPVSVSISPTSAKVLTGASQQFSATVSNTSNTAVTWSVGGAGCSGSSCGVISSSGFYTAPSSVPSPAQVSVTVTSVADPTKSGTATVTIIPPVSVSISPTTAQVLTGQHEQFTATVLNTSNTAVTWSVSGSGCNGAGCGTVSVSGFYTAPASPPNPRQVTVTATSVADSTKSASATVTVTGPVSVSVSPATAQVVVSTSQQFSATVSGTSNTAVTWSLTGGGCGGTACGTLTSSGLYTAPATIPTPSVVSVTATSVADPTKSSTAMVTIVPPISVTISPTSATVTAGTTQQFLASVSGTGNNSVTWSVSGTGCTGSGCGVISSFGLYTAPSTVPSPAQVTVKVASQVNPSKFATATVTIIPPVILTVSPASATVATGGQRQFSATVTGTSNTGVTWSLSGTGCTGSACGTLSSSGLYTAPGSVPSPAAVTVTATSVSHPDKSASAAVTIVPAIGVSVSPASVQVVTGTNRQFSANVTGTSNTSVTWSLSGSGCSGSNCGTISSSGLYTAPGSIPSPAQVTVKATSVADSTKSGSATVTLIAPVVVAISPTSAVIAPTGEQQFIATVTGSSNKTVEWGVSGSGCTGSACGTITSSGLYTAPAEIPSPATVVVKATAQIDASRSASATVSIVANKNFLLNGPYVFRFTGFDSEGVYEAVGSFHTDGNGHITAGLEDINRTLAPATNVTFTGSYLVGADGRGTMTISGAGATQTFRFALSLSGMNARFIEFDSSGIRGSGVITKQTPTTFALSTFKGAYVVSLAGQDSMGDRIGTLAILYFDGAGSIIGGSMDVNDGGAISPTYGSVNGIYRIDSTGRGLITLSVPGFAGGAFQFVFYVAEADKLVLVSTDQLSASNPVFGGPAELQTGAPFLASALSGPTVFSMAGQNGSTNNVLVGQITFDGVSQPVVDFDENNGGTVTTGNVLTGAYSIEVNGPGNLNLDNSSGGGTTWDLYTIGPNHAYLMDTSADVGMGELTSQEPETTFSNSDITGFYVIGSGEPLLSTSTLTSGESLFNGKTAVSGAVDISTSSSNAAGAALKGTYGVSSSLNNGRGSLTLTSPSGESIALWVTSSSEVLGLDIDPSNKQPVVLYFEQ
jgi:Fe-S cluster assembly iron-binding protein IscA